MGCLLLSPAGVFAVPLSTQTDHLTRRRLGTVPAEGDHDDRRRLRPIVIRCQEFSDRQQHPESSRQESESRVLCHGRAHMTTTWAECAVRWGMRNGLRAAQIRGPRAEVVTDRGQHGRWGGRQEGLVLKRILALLAAGVAFFAIGVPPALAVEIDISIDTVVTADEGSITLLATTDVPPDLIGSSCVGVAKAINQPSVHPGNDLIIASGDGSIVLADVEREAGLTTTTEGVLTLGPTVTVSLRMGSDGVFSAGLIVSIGDECTPPTTTTTTTEPTTTTTMAPSPAIVIEKLAEPLEYGPDGIGHFTITVTNPGPVDLTNVHVTDDIALASDPDSDCPRPDLPDLAVGESHGYDCTVGNLDGVSPFTNEATAIGTGPNGAEVTDTDDAVVVPPLLATTITRPPPTTVPPPTLPETGVPFERVRGVSIVGFVLLLGGITLLGASALMGHVRGGSLFAATAFGQNEYWINLELRPRSKTIYIPIRPTNRGVSPD